jgi:hypothetical protein
MGVHLVDRRSRVGMLAGLFAWLWLAVAWSLQGMWGQDLSPRAYVITPVHSNSVILTYSFYSGNVQFDGSAPITGATGTYSTSAIALYHSFRIRGRSANVNVALPYAIGTFQGNVIGQHQQIYRSGLGDTVLRLSVNLIGGPSMQPAQYSKWKQKRLLGVSVKVIAPSGQYDPLKLVNWGTNRWSFKPELGYSERWHRWVLDAYAGVWFYTSNPQSYAIPLPVPQKESPVGSFEGHLSYDVKPRFWISLDGNFWHGGVASLNGLANPATIQTSSRVGLTASVPITKHQSLKCSYSDGAYVQYGGNYNNVSVGWQYFWLGHPQ